MNILKTYVEEHQLNSYFYENRIYKAFDFLQLLKDLDLKLEYIKSGSTGHCFKAFNDNIICAVKVVAYSNHHNKRYGDIFKKERPENVEFFILETLNKIDNFPHITEIYGGFYTNIDIFKDINIENKKMIEFKKNIENLKYDPICSILLSEYCIFGDLQNYIQNHRQEIDTLFFKVIFFQILASLVIIHDKCDTFKHNDLKCNNVLLQKTDTKLSHFVYKIGSISYKLPNIGVCIKLWDFDFSSGFCTNLKVQQNWAQKLHINEEKNLYYDIHFFFNSLIHILPDLVKETKEKETQFSKELYDFIEFVLPKMYRYESKKKNKKNYRLKYNHQHITPLYLLQIHNFFADFKI